MQKAGPGGSVDGLTRNHSAATIRPIDPEGSVTMTDLLLEEIWRVREDLIKQHGGIEGYFKHVQKLDRAHRQRTQRAKAKPAKLQTRAKRS